MQVMRNEQDTMTVGPGPQFTGEVAIDVISTPSAQSPVMAGVVRFAAGARTAWHRHPLGQMIYVTEGVTLVQAEGGPVEVLHPGDSVHVGPDENHWHGASPTEATVQLAHQDADDTGSHTTWGDAVTDAEYAG